MNAPRSVERGEVQRLALSGYTSDHALHLVLRVEDAAAARAALRAWLSEGRVTFGDARGRSRGIDVGFTYRGLEALRIPDELLRALSTRAPAFAEGAPLRATRRLGDAGDSAPAGWEPMFGIDRAHVLVSIHDDADGGPDAIADQLAGHPDARRGFSGWQDGRIAADHFPDPPIEDGRKVRKVHFGFRDNVTRPTIDPDKTDRGAQLHPAGELLLGHLNRSDFDRWSDATLAADAQDFFRNGSFAALRKIQQSEQALDDYLKAQVEKLQQLSPTPRKVTAAYLKAKMCGRWENGALVAPGETEPPSAGAKGRLPRTEPDFVFGPADAQGLGCPFGSHIRRTNPRDDRLAQPRQRPLFRRGMPYGSPDPGAATVSGAGKHSTAKPAEQEERGLVGLFFCASLEDQFEHIMSEWVEQNPLGPPNRGRAKDPLIGHHDEPDAGLQIPRPDAEPLVLNFDKPFVRTRGTLYALFPSRTGLQRIARSGTEEAAQPPAKPAARGRRDLPLQADGAADDGKPPERGAEAGLASDPAPRDRFCDLVLEGGITSGIVYAPAVVELAEHYRFASIAGSSIGAFAAALAAAAEFGRRKGSMTGFQVLGGLPTELARDEPGRTVLERLFRPQPRTRRLFAVFHAMLGRKSTWRRVFDALGAARRAYAWLAWICAALAVLAVLGGPLLGAACKAVGWCAPGPAWPLEAVFSLLSFAVLAALGAFVFAPLVGIVRDLFTGLIDNGFGLCRGWNVRSDDGIPDLTGYLHDAIQKAAGLDPLHDHPLTFADLHAAPGSPEEVLGTGGPSEARRSINLQVYASHLVHGRPYRFPLDAADDTSRLFFRPAEMRRYFPASVVAHLLRVSKRYAPASPSDPGPCDCSTGLYELPQEQLPVVVATRMAMSFPLLISAVPVWSIDYEARRGERHLKRCWMSDGGLCSNFPIHLFDALVPRWPTFGIALEKYNASTPESESVWLPDRHDEGRADTWARGIEPDPVLQKRPNGARRLAAFLLAVWNTTWAWNDQSLGRMPGVRDRVVRIRLKEGEGGVNLRMTRAEILHLASKYGRPAGRAFVQKFVEGPGWDEHRWVRFNRTLIALRQQIAGFRLAARFDHHTRPLGKQIAAAQTAAPLRRHPTDPPQASEQPLTSTQVFELQALRQALQRLEDAFEQAGNTRPYNAVPRPTMRARPPY